ncbi:MAG: hypothetical protein M0Q29_01700 [Thiopseudomonas sp.]|nr:hypothetical protein [Thiopseudomonas sp.]MCK9464582.1 hypothetical protein [Thiopseudomonas sp.]
MHPTTDYTCKHSAAWRIAVAGMAYSYQKYTVYSGLWVSWNHSCNDCKEAQCHVGPDLSGNPEPSHGTDLKF